MTETRADPEVQKVRDRLEELKSLVPPISGFGNDNISTIDAQIQVIDELDELLDEDDVEALYESGDTTIDEYEAAMGVVRWLLGEVEESPTDDWEILAK